MAPVATVDEVEMIDVTTEKEPEPEPVQHQQTVAVITDVLNVVRNDTKIETSIGWVDFEDEDIEIAPIQVETEEIEEETIFIVADQKPSFQGGDLNVFRNWVQARLSYPPLAQENNIQGTVTVKFVVEKDGRLTNIQVLKSPDKTLSDEAVSVLSKSPKWEPAVSATCRCVSATRCLSYSNSRTNDSHPIKAKGSIIGYSLRFFIFCRTTATPAFSVAVQPYLNDNTPLSHSDGSLPPYCIVSRYTVPRSASSE